MILCQYRSLWYVSTGINRDLGKASILRGPKMPHNGDLVRWEWHGQSLSMGVAVGPDLRFFPTIKLRGVEVEPWFPAWHTTSSEPLLNVMNPWNTGEHSLMYFGRHLENKELRDALRADGWEGSVYDGAFSKYVHVDELEKIEGPVPDGPF